MGLYIYIYWPEPERIIPANIRDNIKVLRYYQVSVMISVFVDNIRFP